MDPDGFLDMLAEHGVTRMVLVPSLLRLLLDQIGILGARVPRLTLWTVSGEIFPIDLARRMRASHPNANLLNIYGSSEVAADVTCYEVGELDRLYTVPIGRPISNSQVYILDPSMNPVPFGVLGKIHVGGDCLARGYWQRPDLTAERFMTNPFRAGERIYATGDIGKYRRDGTIDYVGRADGQIKVRGMRVELGEVEVAIAAHPLVGQTAVLVHDAPDGSQELVAYLVGSDSGSAPQSAELRRFLRTRLPQFMVPAHFVWMDRLPVLPSGKLDRQALPRPAANGDASDSRGTPPRNETEEKLVAIWREALHADRIGIEHNFFDLGGHSLLAVQVIARIRRDFGLELPVRSLFEEPTIASLAAAVERAQAAGRQMRMPTIQRRPRATDSREEIMAALNSLPPDQIDALIESFMQQRHARAGHS
jgi:acyl carrier protein